HGVPAVVPRSGVLRLGSRAPRMIARFLVRGEFADAGPALAAPSAPTATLRGGWMADRMEPHNERQPRMGEEIVGPLSAMTDLRVADGEPDIRGWEVVGQDRRTIGRVHDLVVDSAEMKVRYMDVEIQRAVIDADQDRHVLIPIGYARLDEEDDRVLVNNIATTAAGSLPPYEHAPITRAEEAALHHTYADASPAAGAMPERDQDYYGHDRFDDTRFWGKRHR